MAFSHEPSSVIAFRSNRHIVRIVSFFLINFFDQPVCMRHVVHTISVVLIQCTSDYRFVFVVIKQLKIGVN